MREGEREGGEREEERKGGRGGDGGKRRNEWKFLSQFFFSIWCCQWLYRPGHSAPWLYWMGTQHFLTRSSYKSITKFRRKSIIPSTTLQLSELFLLQYCQISSYRSKSGGSDIYFLFKPGSIIENLPTPTEKVRQRTDRVYHNRYYKYNQKLFAQQNNLTPLKYI